MRWLLPTFFALILVLGGLAGVASAKPEIVIVSGHKGGNYDFLARRLRALLLIEHEQFSEVVQSKGSLENLARLAAADDPANVGFTQADALAHHLEDNPSFQEDFMVLGDVGRECVFLVVGKSSEITSASALKAERGMNISVDRPEGGAAVTYEYLSRRDPGFRNTAPVSVDVMEALLELRTGGRHPKLGSAMWVQSPLQISPPLEIVLESPDAFRLVPIVASDVKNATLPDGSPVYSFETVTLNHRGNVHRVETLCTRGLVVVAQSKLAPDQRDELIGLLVKSSTTLSPIAD